MWIFILIMVVGVALNIIGISRWGARGIGPMLKLGKILSAIRRRFNKIMFFFSVGYHIADSSSSVFGRCRFFFYIYALDIILFFCNRFYFIMLAVPLSRVLPDYYEPHVITYENQAWFPNMSADKDWPWDGEWYDQTHFAFWFDHLSVWEDELISFETDLKWKGPIQTYTRKLRVLALMPEREFWPFLWEDDMEVLEEKLFHNIVEIPIAWYVFFLESSWEAIKGYFSVIDFDDHFIKQVSFKKGQVLYFVCRFIKKMIVAALLTYKFFFTTFDIWYYLPGLDFIYSKNLLMFYLNCFGIYYVAQRYCLYNIFIFVFEVYIWQHLCSGLDLLIFYPAFLLEHAFRLFHTDISLCAELSFHVLDTTLYLYFSYLLLYWLLGAKFIEIYINIYVFFFAIISSTIFVILHIFSCFFIFINFILKPYYMPVVDEACTSYIANKKEFLLFMDDVDAFCRNFVPLVIHVVKTWNAPIK